MACNGQCGSSCCGSDGHNPPARVGDDKPAVVLVERLINAGESFGDSAPRVLSVTEAAGLLTPYSFMDGTFEPHVVQDVGARGTGFPYLPPLGAGSTGGVPLPAVPADVQSPLCLPTDTRISRFQNAQEMTERKKPPKERADAVRYQDAWGRAIYAPEWLPADISDFDTPTPEDVGSPERLMGASTGPGGFRLYPLLKVEGEDLSTCFWRQVFFEDTVIEEWGFDGMPSPSAVHATGRGQFSEGQKKGTVDWGPRSATEQVDDVWGFKTSQWARIKVYLRDQVSGDDKFRSIILCRDYTIQWDNLSGLAKSGGRRNTSQANHAKSKGFVTIRIGPLKHLMECPV